MPHLFSWKYLTSTPSDSLKYPIPILAILFALIIAGFILQFASNRNQAPRFYKKFTSHIMAFLLYMPVLLIFLVLIRVAGIEGAQNLVWSAFILAIWLIWFLFLIYYRIVVVAQMWRKYHEVKKEEKYFKNDKARRKN